MKILIIEDNPKVIKTVALALKAKWVEVNLISTVYGEEGVKLVKKELPDLVILDLMLPDMDGFQVLGQIRRFSDVLVVILTGREEEDNRIKGLQEGADDYIVKPFSPDELVARMKSLIRRIDWTKTKAAIATKPSIRKRLDIDFANETVTFDGRLLKIGPREYELIHLLATNKGKVLSKQMLMKEVFPENKDDTRFVEAYIKRIREKLEEEPDKPKIILNEGTTGYKFVGSYFPRSNKMT